MVRRTAYQGAEELFMFRLGVWVSDRIHDVEGAAHCQKIGEAALAFKDAWHLLSGDCESPIEELMAVELLFACDGYHDFDYDMTQGAQGVPDFGTTFTPQAKIGKYNVDFLVTAHVKGLKSHIVIECDGHDFHERTKEQAKSDKSRDRSMAAEGIKVLRFTGSEIWADPEKCRMEVESIVYGELSELLKKAGIL